MSYPISEQIRLKILTDLAGIQTVAGANNTLLIEPFKGHGQNTVGDSVAILNSDDDQENEDSPDNFTSWITPYKLLVQIFEPDNSALLNQRIRTAEADVWKLAMRDVTWGGVAQNTFLRPSQRFTDSSDICGVLVRFDVHFRHLETDPTSMTE